MSLFKDLGEGIGNAVVKGLEKNIGPAAAQGIDGARPCAG